jgi:hypothetical protein
VIPVSNNQPSSWFSYQSPQLLSLGIRFICSVHLGVIVLTRVVVLHLWIKVLVNCDLCIWYIVQVG